MMTVTSDLTRCFSVLSFTKKFNEALMAVWFVILFLESSLVQLLEAERAHKVFLVKLLAHGADATTCNWFLTSSAQRSTLAMVVRLTIG